MATNMVQQVTCDVFGTQRDVNRYRVTIEKINEKNEPLEEKPTQSTIVDMGPRALKRLKGFIERGTSRPGPKEIENDGTS